MNILDSGVNNIPKSGKNVSNNPYGIAIYCQGEGARGDNIYLICLENYWVTSQSYFIPSTRRAFDILCDAFGFDVILQILLDKAGGNVMMME